MARSANWPFSNFSSVSAFGLAALLAAAARGQEPPWSEPVVNTYTPQPGVSETVSASKRNFVEGGRRTLESRSDIELRTPGWKGQYVLRKKQVYAEAKLVTFYRELDADLSGPQGFSLSERTQLAKGAKGSFKGTFLREYYLAGREGRGPALRLLVHFEPYLLVRRYDAKLFSRNDEGSWPLSAQGHGESFAAAMAALARGWARGPREPAAEFLLALWSGAMSQGASMEMAQFLYPLLNSGAEPYFEEVKLDPLLSRSQAALAAVGSRAPELARWQELAKSLTSRRVALERAVTPEALKRDAAGPQEVARLYEQAVELLVFSPKRPAPSPIQALQATTIWAASAFGRYRSLARGSGESAKFLAALPAGWARLLASHRAEVYLRSLYVLALTRETRTLQHLIQIAEKALGAGELAGSLTRVRTNLAGVAGAWRTPLASRPRGPELPGTLLSFLARLLVPSAWAADTQVQRAGAPGSDQGGYPTEILGMELDGAPLQLLPGGDGFSDMTGVGREVSHPAEFLQSPAPAPAALPESYPPAPPAPDTGTATGAEPAKADCK